MDPFNDKLEDEVDEIEEESHNDRSFSSNHTKEADDDEFNRVSLPRDSHRQSRINDTIDEKNIRFRLENEEDKDNGDIENPSRPNIINGASSAGTDDPVEGPNKRRANFGDLNDSDEDDDPAGKKGKGTQGTIIGVFMPCLQSILGIILFLRLPSITGEAGLIQTYVIIFLCTSATCLTTLSMNAIATNGKMSKGGAYYLLSRSLGPATGGALGLLFYFATTISGAMYILGSVEAFMVASGIGIVNHGITIRVLSL